MPATPRAKFTIQHQGAVVALIDNGSASTMSVTNDAENVVRYLYEEGVARGATPIVYRDTMGRWDGLAHDGHGHFTGFVMIGAESMEEAVVRAWDASALGETRVGDLM